jgi:hypothetical protein
VRNTRRGDYDKVISARKHCAMMPEDMGGCVSDKLLFHGISQLSIVDASII